ncbi:DUF302 domain-containing protein [Nitrogeniibacter mangrovi]|uniref:DUF302 domain-containing protein n=1 Tax=Nitrogeniibacter mangrovi TaxID=2016596 RepID=A0A6C1B1H8_9RHOO|nr:DUF302 domain-containing protein [Nitrogeniibacter mangrovi]QID17471.1 DUF302 domain-containing protein [Nitrogeniibacter mangrovi]
MRFIRLLALCLLALGCTLARADDATRRLRIADADYQIALESLQIAIVNQGLNIAARQPAAKVLQRTAKDLGHRPDLLLDGEILSFCSIRIGAMLAAEDPHNIVYCPMTVAVYRIPQDPTAVYLAWRHLPDDTPGRRAANALLQKIVDETADSSGE